MFARPTVRLTLAALTLTTGAAFSYAQTDAKPTTSPAPATTAPATTKPAKSPLTPEQIQIIKEADRADVPFQKIYLASYSQNGELNSNFGQLEPQFQDQHENFLKRKEKPIGVLFLGDSITQGWGNQGKAVWTERYAKLDAANFGIWGDRTQHVLWRIENGELDGISPKVVVLMIGSNNSNSNNKQEVTAGITAIVNKINEKLPNTKVLLLGIFPRGAAGTDDKGKPSAARAKLTAINAEIAKLDDGKKTFYLDIGPKFLDEKGAINADVMPDAIHPNAKGYQIWADAMQPKLDELLE